VRRQQSPKKYTGTACPDCGLQQWECPSGIICDNGDGYAEPSDTPFAALRQPEEQSLDEVLADTPTERTKARKEATKGHDVDAVQGSLGLGKMERIVERVFTFDFDEAYDRVQTFLKPGDDKRLDFGLLRKELNEATEIAALAHRLYTNAREAREVFEIDKELIEDAMREGARHVLENEKHMGSRRKAITDLDVASMMRTQDPAKARHLRIQSIRMKATVDHLEELAGLAKKRQEALKTLVEKQ
jgi:hypothetical protein